MKNFQGQVAIISGASSGIGESLALEMARRGAKVGLLARREDRLAALAERVRNEVGGEAAYAAADVSDTEATHAALDQIRNALGGCDIVVANAGYGRPEPPAKFEPGRSITMYDVNLLGTLRMVDWAMPNFIERRRGQIVGVASVASFIGMPHAAAYCGSKAAMRIHLQSLRLSLKRYGIAVTTICPGFVKSELTDLNPGPMPFMWPTDRATRRMADSIAKRRAEDVFPWQMNVMVQVMTRLPLRLREALLRRMPGI